jgi:hypothetical protein
MKFDIGDLNKYIILVFVILSIILIKRSTEIGISKRSLKAENCNKIAYNGTTRNIQQIFLGRCYYFLNILQKDNCLINANDYSCNDIWNEFYNVIKGKEPCSLTIDSFSRLLTLANQTIPPNTSLFWSGTYTPAHEITKTREYWSLEDTFSGLSLI